MKFLKSTFALTFLILIADAGLMADSIRQSIQYSIVLKDTLLTNRKSKTPSKLTRETVKNAIEVIRNGNRNFVEGKLSPKDFSKILSLVVEVMQHIDGHDAYENIIDAAEKKPDLYQKALLLLTPYERNMLNEAFKTSEESERFGNG